MKQQFCLHVRDDVSAKALNTYLLNVYTHKRSSFKTLTAKYISIWLNFKVLNKKFAVGLLKQRVYILIFLLAIYL